jgi:hypothetical protein
MKRWFETIATGAIVLSLSANAGAQAKGAKKDAPKAEEKPSAAGAAVASGAPVGQSTQAGWLKAGANECISGEAKKALSACPGGNIKKSSGKKGGQAFMETDVGQPKKAEKKVGKPVEISIDRPSPQIQKKLETSLMTEIVALEQQLAKTKVTSDKHVTISRRLAESYYELERLKQNEALDLTTKILNGEKKKDPNVATWRAQRTKAESLRDKSQGRVTEIYQLIIDKHEDYPKLDEVMYYLAYEYEQQKATDPNDKAQIKKERESKEKALATYLMLIKKRPKSKFVSAAYIAYGDLYFEDALNGKIDWKIPLEAYDRVIQSGDPPDNKQWGYAQYKKGFIYWNLGQYKDAVTAFKKAIEFGTKFSDLPKAPQIAEEARKELVPVYAEYGKATEAYGFFSGVSGDKPGDKTKTITMLEKLGEEYLARAHPLEAKALFTELKGHNPSNSCYYDTRITEAVINLNPKDKPAIKAQLAQLTKGWATYRDNPSAPADKKQACGNQTAWLLSEHAIAWEYEALGDLGCPPDAEKKAANPKARPGTCNKDTIGSSIDVFKLILTTFKTFEGYKFNVKRPEDAPTIPKLKYAYADLLYGQGRWEECGPAFDEVVALDPNSEVAGDAAFAAVLCYQNVYDAQYKNVDKQESKTGKGSIGKEKTADETMKKANAPKEFTTYQAKMVGSFDRFVCYVKPDPSSKTYKEDQEKLIEIKHRRGFIYYDAKHWDEAAEAFKEVAYSHPEHEYGVVDAGFYLDAVVRIYLYADPARANCGTQMGDDVDKLVGLYCDKDKVTARLKDKKKAEEFLNTTAAQCDRLLQARADLDAIKAQDLAKAEKFEEAAAKFEKLADDVCTGALAQAELDKKATDGGPKKKPAPKGKGAKVDETSSGSACDERGDVYLYNAALNYQKASKIKRAMDIRKDRILKRDQWKSKETYRMTMYDLAEDYRRIAVYGLAAEWYEKYAAADVKVDKLLELAGGKIETEKAAHPEKYKDKKNEDVAKEYTEEQRASALSNAVVLRLGLGQEDEAIKDSETFDKRFGAKRKEQARQIFLAIGEHYVEQGDWKKGLDRLEKFIKQYPDARLDEKLRTRALAGRASKQMKKGGDADKYFGEIKEGWAKGRDKQREEIEGAAKANPNNSKIRQNAYSAVAEAYLHFADKEYDKANAVKFEPYKGGGDDKSWEAYFKDKFAPYIKKRIEANEPAYRSYQKVFCLGEGVSADAGCTREWKDIGETYASKFVVEAASKAGDLYADTYDKARNAPLGNALTDLPGDSPNIKKEKGILRSLFFRKLDQVAEPIKTPARTAFKECLEVSTQAKFFDEYSERCEKWLAKVYKNEYRTLEEKRPEPGLVGSGLKDRAFLVDSKLVPFDVTGRK